MVKNPWKKYDVEFFFLQMDQIRNQVFRQWAIGVFNRDGLACFEQRSKFSIQFLNYRFPFVIRDRYVPSFWTANLEFTDKKSILTKKLSFRSFFSMWIRDFADKKSANNGGRLYCLKSHIIYQLWILLYFDCVDRIITKTDNNNKKNTTRGHNNNNNNNNKTIGLFSSVKTEQTTTIL